MSDTALTIARNRCSALSNYEHITGFNQKYNVQYSDVAYGSTSADTVTLTLGSTFAKWAVDRAAVNVTTAFAGTTAFTLTVGTSTNPAAFVSSQSVLTAGIKWAGTAGFPVNAPGSATGTTVIGIVAKFTNATDGSPSALTAGALDIYLSMVNTDRDLG